jgi:hypothetical protein
VTLPQVRIEVGFTSPYVGTFWSIGDPIRGKIGSVPIGPDEIWSDVTEWAKSWSIRRGASQGNQPQLRFEPGTATIVLNDPDRRFDPDNLAGPYVSSGISEVTSMRRVRISAIWNGVAYPIFQGYSDDWVPDFQGDSWTYVTLTATDASKIFAAYDRQPAGPLGAGETSGARIGRILGSVGWPTEDREIGTGVETLQATALQGNALTELQLVQDTELGMFYVDAAGKAVFRARNWVLTAAEATTAQATFGDGGYLQLAEYDFDAGVAEFWAFGGGVAASNAQFYNGTHSLLLTASGAEAQAYTRQWSAIPVQPGRRYLGAFWVYYPAGGFLGAAIDWFGPTGTYLTTSYQGHDAVPAGVWTQLTIEAVAPDGAYGAGFGPTLESPAPGTQLYLDALTLRNTDNELPYADVQLATGDETMANIVSITRIDGTPQTVENSDSVVRFLPRSYERSDLIMQSDSSALDYARMLLYQFGQPIRRFERLEFRRPRVHMEGEVWPAVLARDFGHRVTVRRRPYGGGEVIEHDVFIRGIEHSSDGERWDTGFTLSPADKFSYWTIGHPNLGRVGAFPIAY